MIPSRPENLLQSKHYILNRRLNTYLFRYIHAYYSQECTGTVPIQLGRVRINPPPTSRRTHPHTWEATYYPKGSPWAVPKRNQPTVSLVTSLLRSYWRWRHFSLFEEKTAAASVSVDGTIIIIIGLETNTRHGLTVLISCPCRRSLPPVRGRVAAGRFLGPMRGPRRGTRPPSAVPSTSPGG